MEQFHGFKQAEPWEFKENIKGLGLSVFNIYKKGQGKYVRLGTVAGVGLLILLGTRWVDNKIIPLEPSYVKAIVSLAIGAAGAWFCFWVVNKPKFAEFMILTESEMRKVAWPLPRVVVNATKLVILLVLLLAGMLWLVDFGFIWFFQAIHVLT